MEGNQVRKYRIEIPLSSKPRLLQPGDSPALAPVQITLENDTNAFIADKRVLSTGTRVNGDLKLQMYYVVGWPDLPAARVAILATKIYDYVSPRTLEDWEYNRSLEQDEERERQESEQRRKLEQSARTKSNSAAPSRPDAPRTGAVAPLLPGQKKRGRPSKADMLARRIALQTSVDSSQRVETPLPRTRSSGPSLSTPKKKRLAAAAGLISDEEESEEINSDEAILKQLQGSDDDVIGDQDAKEAWSAGSHSVLSSTFSTQEPRRKPFSRLRPPSKPLEHRHRHTDLYTNDEARALPFTDPRRKRKRNGSLPMSEPDTPIVAAAAASLHKKQKSTFAGSHKDNLPASKPKLLKSVTPNGASPIIESKSILDHYGFTPAGRSTGKFQSEDVDELSYEAPRAVSHRPESAKPRKTKANVEPEEPTWEVKRLEAHKIVEINGTRERYFKVRWKGHWPPDTNPSWEPESNIAHQLVKNYLKKLARDGDADSPRITKVERPNLTRSYSSVSEAFEGAAENQLPRPNTEVVASEPESDEGTDDDQLRVVENGNTNTSPFGNTISNPTTARQLASSLFSNRRSGSSES
ncbi:hypothetical protein F5Y15DRAFT_392840 [Xylariaceae sp. FL0016]|nr:hypothetical protein F5Y15DRAFT_392840 [Xylariaceae sp. FL0016]